MPRPTPSFGGLDEIESTPFDNPDLRNASRTTSGAGDTRPNPSAPPLPRSVNRANRRRAFDNGDDRNGDDRNDDTLDTDFDTAPFPNNVARIGNRRPPAPKPVKSRTDSKTADSRKADGKSSSRSSRALLLPPARKPPRALSYEIAGILCLFAGVLLLYNALQEPQGSLPRVGVMVLQRLFGIGAVILPVVACLLGLVLMVYRHRTNLRAFGRGASVSFLVLLTAIHLQVPAQQELDLGERGMFSHGGYIGGIFSLLLRRGLGEFGAVIFLVAFSLIALLLFTETSLAEVATRLGGRVRDDIRSITFHKDIASRLAARREEYEDEEDDADEPEYSDEPAPSRNWRNGRSLPPEINRDARAAAPKERNPALKRPSPFLPVDDVLQEAIVEPHFHLHDKTAAPEPAAPEPVATEAAATGPRVEIVNAPPPVSVVAAPPSTPADAATAPELSVPLNRPDDELTPVEALEAQAQETAGSGETIKKARPAVQRRSFGDGPLMPEYFDDAVRSLDPPIPLNLSGFEADIQQGVQSVQETLAAFKIDATVTDVKRGPVITRYEVQPAPGVRVAAIANLDRDIARALSAIAVRIEAPVPGKNVVGIEVPNKKVHLVRLRDVLELPEFLSAQSKLAFVLGKDIAGQPKWADLTKMPHMLIAGATNSGKSVCLNSIITSIITRATPEEVKLSLIDPKRVELTLYRGIPHLYHPVVVEPKDAVRALRGAIAEMDRRYKRFAERGVRNIASYNAKLQDDEAPLPYLVIVIDELADLMMTAAAEFEKLICRLAQLARATGIHLIVATQRPSVNVITGVIKANIPARIAFAVASQVDSRTILDSVGAERLIGSGDMLFDANNGGKSMRIQGAYLSEEEVNRIVEVVKVHYAADGPIEYGLDLSSVDVEGGSGGDDDMSPTEEKRDSLYDEIKEFVVRHDEMSASMIQRKFEIGYPRAGRIVDQLERDGVLSPADGSKARKVLGAGRN